MALNVVAVTPANLAANQARLSAAVDGFDPTLRCSVAGDLVTPSKAWLAACVNEVNPRNEVSACIEDGSLIAGFIVVQRDTARILWLCTNSNAVATFEQVATALCNFAKTRYGIAWGIVENPTVQTRMVNSGRFTLSNGTRMDWT